MAPATITVTDNGDAVGVDFKVTLREALQSINTGSDANADVASTKTGTYGSGDAIIFSGFFATAKTILLGSTLAVNKSVTINGPAAELTVSGQNLVRVMNINIAAGDPTVAISNLTLTAGNGGSTTVTANRGGGLRIQDEDVTLTYVKVNNSKSAAGGGGIFTAAAGAKLTLQNSDISGNTTTFNGGGVYMTGGTLIANNSNFSNNSAYYNGGGGFVLAGTNATINVSSITGNHADSNLKAVSSGYGGGILVMGLNNNLTIRGSSITGNTATGGGASSGFGGYGGGIATYYQATGNITLTNCTVSSNIANKGLAISTGGHGGGIAIGYQPNILLTINACTFAYNKASVSGGNIFAYYLNSNVVIDNSIISDGTSPAGPDIFGSPPITATYTLVGNSNGAVITANSTNKLDVPAMLDPVLALNGGTTLNHAILPGSAAIDTGNDGVMGAPLNLMTDQRNASRKSGAHVDIGSFEVQNASAKVASYKINDGSPQRSRVTSLSITFDQPASLPANPGEAFQLKRQSDSANVTLSGSVAGNTVTLTFTGGPLDFGSLADGRYTLTALASKISNLDGNGDGTPGDDYVLVGTPANGLFRLFGDADGNGNVGTTDFNAFRAAFGGSSTIFDFDNQGGVSTSDFNAFRTRFGSNI